MLAKKPGFTAMVVLVLAVGIGANTTVYTGINTFLKLFSSSSDEPDRIVMLEEKNRPYGINESLVSYERFFDWQQGCHAFEAMAFGATGVAELLTENQIERLPIIRWSPDVCAVLGIRLHLGRAFAPDEDQVGKNQVALVSYSFWKSHLGADPAILGQTLTLDGELYRIIGVLPAKAGIWGMLVNVWIPLPKQMPPSGDMWGPLGITARLKTGVSRDQAQAEVIAVATSLTPASTGAHANWTVEIASLEQDSESIAKKAYLFQIPVGLVLLVACSNAASLILVRGCTRRREMSIRLALGARRTRIVGQLLTESIVCALLAGIAGVGANYIGMLVLRRLAPPEVSTLLDGMGFRVDAWVLIFVLSVSMLTGILCGLFPALHLSQQKLSESLRVAAPSPLEGRSRSRFFNGLVVTQIALSLVLLMGTGLVVRSLLQVRRVDLGFNPEGILATTIHLPKEHYPQDAAKRDLYRRLLEKTLCLPGVQAVAASSNCPQDRSAQVNIRSVGDREVVPQRLEEMPRIRVINPEYFAALRTPLLKGRCFESADEHGTSRTVIINETLAQRLWSDQNPVGQQVDILDNNLGVHEVIGVVENIACLEFKPEYKPTLYIPFTKCPADTISLAIRTNTDPMQLANTMREIIAQAASDVSVRWMESLSDSLASSLFAKMWHALIFFTAILATVALILSTTGIYGIMTYAAQQRTHEIGIRLALGAHTGHVLSLTMKRGIALILLGLAIGAPVAFGLARLLASLLYDVSPADPVTLVCVSLLLGGTALLACYLPARRAAKVDPMEALRCE